jgi:leucyl aminopeptidase
MRQQPERQELSLTSPKLSLTTTTADEATADAVIIGTVQGGNGTGVTLAPGSERIDAAFGGALAEVLRTVGATGAQDEVVKIPSMGKVPAGLVVAAGLGKSTDDGPTAEQVRRASGAAARALAGTGRAVTTLSTVDLQAAVEGIVLGAYRFTGYRSDKGDAPVERVDVVAPADGAAKDHRATLKAATAIAEAVCTARDLVNTPPNDLFPASFAERAAALAKAVGVEVEILDEKALRKGGFGGVLGVGMGSTRPPRVVRMTWKGPKARKKVALVGKGITFDTGGISIKPAANMDEMTSDMSGAAAIVATMVLAAKLKYPLELTATVPMAENMPSGAAYRPGDVLTMYGGKTVSPRSRRGTATTSSRSIAGARSSRRTSSSACALPAWTPCCSPAARRRSASPAPPTRHATWTSTSSSCATPARRASPSQPT